MVFYRQAPPSPDFPKRCDQPRLLDLGEEHECTDGNLLVAWVLQCYSCECNIHQHATQTLRFTHVRVRRTLKTGYSLSNTTLRTLRWNRVHHHTFNIGPSQRAGYYMASSRETRSNHADPMLCEICERSTRLKLAAGYAALDRHPCALGGIATHR